MTNANETLRPLHDRMPVILEQENVAQWLSGQSGTELLVPAAEEKLTSWPVSTHVNKAGGAGEATFIIKVSWSAIWVQFAKHNAIDNPHKFNFGQPK